MLHARALYARTNADVVLVAAFALALRVWNLLALPIFWDEAIYLRWSLDIWEQRTRAALLIPIADDGKQPLFMWLAGGAAQLLSDPLVAGRLVSALAGTAAAVGLYVAGCWLAGRAVGLLAALLYSVAPFSLLFDRMALVDALLNTAGIWAFAAALFLTARTRGGREATVGGVVMGIALGAALWTKMTALFMLAFPALCFLLLAERGRLRRSAGGLAVGYALAALFGALLALAPEASRLLEKTEQFSLRPSALLTFPVALWWSHATTYADWIQTYLPAPLWWLLPAAAVWGLVRRPRHAVLLLGCWLVFSLPPALTARKMYESRYLMPGLFPLLLLASEMLVAAWQRVWDVTTKTPRHQEERREKGISSLFSLLSPLFSPLGVLVSWWLRLVPVGQRRPVAAGFLLLGLIGPSLEADRRILGAPETVAMVESDSHQYVTGWPSGYRFIDALGVLKQRAAELTRTGQPIIVLTDGMHGLPHDGLGVYMRATPLVSKYIDMHLFRDAEGFPAAWRSHRVPILVIANEGTDHLEEFERAVPAARRIGYFPKPGGRSSFRVYEIGPDDL